MQRRATMETIDNAIYDRIPDDWWSDDSFMALLRNAVNPPRFAYFHDILVRRFGRVPQQLSVLDVGCGGGLLAERFAAIGCAVTGVDRSIPTLMAARKRTRAPRDSTLIISTATRGSFLSAPANSMWSAAAMCSNMSTTLMA